MKIEIKSYKSCRADEGDAYSCTLYLDGKKAASVRYGGTGGPVDFDFSVAAGAANKWMSGPMHDKFKAYVDSLPAEESSMPDPKDPSKPWMMKPNMDIVVDEAINLMLENRQMKRWCKTKVVFRYEGAPKGEYQTCKAKWAGNEVALRAQVAKWAAADGKVVEEIFNERFAA